MKIVVPVKYVPEPTSTWTFTDDLTIDRATCEGHLSELDEYAVEQAVRLVEGGLDAEVVALTVGPARAVDAIRKALAMGADSAIHVLDDAMVGSDALATSLVLAKALQHSGFDLVLCGMSSTDAEMSVVPAMVAQRLGVAQVTFASSVVVDGGSGGSGSVTVRRDGDTATEEVVAALPAVVSVTDQIGEPRYPAFKAIMASKKKPVTTLSLADLGVDAGSVGLAAAACRTRTMAPRPPRQAGTVVIDEGDGAVRLADFLVGQGFL